MRPSDKKKMAMIIVGSKPSSSDDSYDSDNNQEEKEENLEKEAMKITMKKFMKALSDEDVEKAMKCFQELTQFNPQEEDSEEEEY